MDKVGFGLGVGIEGFVSVCRMILPFPGGNAGNPGNRVRPNPPGISREDERLGLGNLEGYILS